MNSNKKGSIYIRENEWYKRENVVKMGISKEVIYRNTSYFTGELTRGECIYIIEVPLDNLKPLDTKIKRHFKEHQVYKGGGTEFYNKCIVDLIEPFLKELNIEYNVLSKEELDLINQGKRIINNTQDNIIVHSEPRGAWLFRASRESENNICHDTESPKFSCEKCSYFTNDKQSYDRHCLSKKHNSEKDETLCNYICCICNKKYKSNVGLWRHKKTCELPGQKKHSSTQVLEEQIKQFNDKHSKELEELKNLILKLEEKHFK